MCPKCCICGPGVMVAAELVRPPGLLFYFLGLCLSSTVWNNRWMDIHEFSGYGHKQQLARLFQAWLGTLEVCALRVVLVSSTPTSICFRFRLTSMTRTLMVHTLIPRILQCTSISMNMCIIIYLVIWTYFSFLRQFLTVTKQLYERSCPFVCPSVCLLHLFHNVSFIVSSWNNYQWHKWCHVKGQSQRSIVKFTEFGHLRTLTPVWIHRWLWYDAQQDFFNVSGTEKMTIWIQFEQD